MARAQCVAPLPNTLYQWYCPVGRHTAVAPLTAASALVVSLCSEAPQPLLRGATASGPQLSTAGNSTRVSSHLLLGGHTCNPELGQGPLWSGFQCSAPLLTALSQRCSPVGRLAFGTPPSRLSSSSVRVDGSYVESCSHVWGLQHTNGLWLLLVWVL